MATDTTLLLSQKGFRFQFWASLSTKPYDEPEPKRNTFVYKTVTGTSSEIKSNVPFPARVTPNTTFARDNVSWWQLLNNVNCRLLLCYYNIVWVRVFLINHEPVYRFTKIYLELVVIANYRVIIYLFTVVRYYVKFIRLIHAKFLLRDSRYNYIHTYIRNTSYLTQQFFVNNNSFFFFFNRFSFRRLNIYVVIRNIIITIDC